MASSLVNNKYRITRRIGGGSFGEIYMGVGPNNEKVAVKFERHGTRCPQLRHEYKVYRELTNCHGFCSVYHFGTQDNYNVMVMDLLGPSLEDLFNKCSRRFSLKTVLQIADQMLERADTLHSRHLIHRDVKPANFVIGVQETAANVFCVDFGLSKRYRHPKNLHHIPHRDGRSLTGTPRYASINNHLGIEQSRRDDLESIGYVLIYFLKGTLPWQGLKAKNAQKKYRLILEKKQQVSIAQLCQGCPSQFAEFLAYTRSLKFDAKPDIPYLRKLFRDLYHAQGCGAIPKLWDWDGMEGNDFTSTPGQPTAPAVTAAPVTSAAPALRPNTAAAVAGPGQGGGLETDMMGQPADDLDVDYEMHKIAGDGRPNTAGPMMQGGYRGATGAQAGASWGYSRQDPSMGAGGSAAMLKQSSAGMLGGEYGGEAPVTGQRRPHTAHGARAGVPSTMGQGEYEGEEDADGHVVAGARGMMRYRRNRASTLEGGGGSSNGGQPPAQTMGYGSGAGGGQGAAPWAQYQTNSKGGSGQVSASGGRPGSTGGNSGWQIGDRPKSANPTTGAGGQQVGDSNSNTLSYGSLKNRFLAGGSKTAAGGSATGGAGTGAAHSSQGSGKAPSSKLFSLQR